MKRGGFTFWQMVGALALIAIAGVLILPTFRARESGGSRDHCVSNLKQIGLGLRQYLQDYDERYPANAADWPAASQPYLKSWQLFQCSLDRNGSAPQTSDYFFNARLLGEEERNIRQFNLTILAGDGLSDQKSATLSGLPAWWRTDQSSPAFRHLDGANYAFTDGHVKWFKPERITLDAPSKGNPTFLVK